MPEYLAPGVFLEEVSARQKTIEGVGTSTTGFVGPCRFGPVCGEQPLLRSYAEFESIYGGLEQLQFAAQTTSHNYLAQAVRAYFKEGGSRLYVTRVFLPLSDSDGIAKWEPTGSGLASTQTNAVSLRARYPGAAGDFSVTFIFKQGQNILVTDTGSGSRFQGAGEGDVVWAQTIAESQQSPSLAGQFYWVHGHGDAMRLRPKAANDGDPTGFIGADELASAEKITLNVSVSAPGQSAAEQVWEGVTFDPAHPDSLVQIFAAEPGGARKVLRVPLVFESGATNGAELADALSQIGNLVDGTPTGLSLGMENDPWCHPVLVGCPPLQPWPFQLQAPSA